MNRSGKNESTLGILKAELYRAFCNKLFVMSVLGISIVYSIFVLYELRFGADKSAGTMYFYVLSQSMNALRYVSLILGALPYAASFCTDWKTQNIKFVLIRCNHVKYGMIRTIVTALSAFTAVFLGILIFIAWLCLFTPTSVVNDSMFGLLFGSLLKGNSIYLYLLLSNCCSAMGAAFFAVLALCISTRITDSFVTVCTPVIAYYAINTIFRIIKAPTFLNVTALLRPDNLTGIGIKLGDAANTFLYISLYYLTFILLLGCMNFKQIQRRMKNG